MEEGFIVHAFERSRSGRMEIDLVGRLANGETFAVVERRARPFLAVREADFAAVRTVIDREGDGVAVTSWQRTTMDGAPTLRVEVATPIRLRDLRDSLHRAGVRTYEADVKPSIQLLVDAGIHAAVSIDGSWRAGRRVQRVYEDPAIGPAGAGFEPHLSVLSLDIETDRTGRAVWAVGLAFTGHDGAESAEVLLNGGGAASARCFPSEKDLLLELRRRILELDPDILTGWNIVDFDFRALHRRFGDLGVPFDIGRSDSPAMFLDREGREGGVRWRRSRAIADGRQVMDALWLVRLSGMGLEDYRLETVARALLGRGKLIDRRPGESGVEAIERLYRTDPEALCAYCLGDARLVLDILASEGFLDTALHKSLLIGTTLDQTWVSVASFEYLYLEHLHRRGMVAPTLGVDQDPMERSPGGGLITPRAGLADNVLTFDFRSLYPSLIRTFNIDPLTRVVDAESAARGGADPGPGPGAAGDAGPAADVIIAPNGARFRREPGILPDILERFFVERTEAKRRGDERSSYAYKIVMNSFYGVLGTEGCRFAAPELAGAITSFGQHVLFWARDLITAEGLEVLYGDTDSLFVRSGLPRGAPASELRGMGERLCRLVNGRLADYVRERWAVDSRLELEFETVYRRFFLPPMRTLGTGSEDGEDAETRGRAKGYAGLRLEDSGERLEIVGMEAVRHDWTELAHALQRDLLGWVFHDVPPADIVERVRALLRDLRAGLKDELLTYRRSLRKPVEAYTKSSPPHVRAAALLPPEERSGLIRYVWTREGPQPESRRSSPFDYDHYAEKQLAPIVEAVAPYIGLDLEAIFASDRQLRLF
ncbi:MAG: DNA polymerase II [Spirochaetes bacterium]|nr:DNA polymerase II [Spirochaetota bacterium]